MKLYQRIIGTGIILAGLTGLLGCEKTKITDEPMANSLPPQIESFYDSEGKKAHSVVLNSALTYTMCKDGVNTGIEFTDIDTKKRIILSEIGDNLYSDGSKQYTLRE